MSKSILISFSILFLCLAVFTFGAQGDVNSPLLHWGMDGNGDDSVGNKDLKIVDGDFVPGVYDQALSLDGSGAHAVDEDGADYINGLDAITIAMWIKSNQIGTDKGFFICHEPEGSDRYLSFRYDSSGSNGGGNSIIKVGMNTDGGKTAFESSNDIQTTEWQHVAMVWESGADIKLYIDGVEDIPTDVEATVNGVTDGLPTVIIGKAAKDAGGGWDGLIDDVYIYEEALSEGDIIKVMDGGVLSVDAGGKLATLWGKIKKD